jgi:DnaK suppressor protein
MQLKKELINKKAILLGLHRSNHNTDMSVDEFAPKDLIDRSDFEEAWFNKERLSIHWKAELIQIDNSLSRMDSGTFGICENCDSEIPLKRLRVRPDATLCLQCQESFERESRSQVLH